jgi:hypothetical protein
LEPYKKFEIQDAVSQVSDQLIKRFRDCPYCANLQIKTSQNKTTIYIDNPPPELAKAYEENASKVSLDYFANKFASFTNGIKIQSFSTVGQDKCNFKISGKMPYSGSKKPEIESLLQDISTHLHNNFPGAKATLRFNQHIEISGLPLEEYKKLSGTFGLDKQ